MGHRVNAVKASHHHSVGMRNRNTKISLKEGWMEASACKSTRRNDTENGLREQHVLISKDTSDSSQTDKRWEMSCYIYTRRPALWWGHTRDDEPVGDPQQSYSTSPLPRRNEAGSHKPTRNEERETKDGNDRLRPVSFWGKTPQHENCLTPKEHTKICLKVSLLSSVKRNPRDIVRTL